MQPILSIGLQESTQSLIENLLASEAFTRYGQAGVCLNQDSEARTLLERLNHSQANLRQKQASGGMNQAEVDSLRLLQQRAQRNPIIMEYVQSQTEAISLLREIDGEISGLLGINFASFANHSTC